jgi:prepilin-type N-terminal cleavage/methylation domain-containing protein
MSLLRTCLLLCLWSIACQGGEAASTAPASIAPANTVVVTAAPDLREALASATQERDQLAVEIERLGHQRGLLLVVVALLMGAVAWLARTVLLSAKSKPLVAESMQQESEPFPDLPGEIVAATTVTIRKNATITIRNGATQREEVSGQVQTRRFFTATEARRAQLSRRESTISETQREESAAPALATSTTPARDPAPALAATPITPPPTAPRTARTTRVSKVLDVSEADLPADLQPSTERMLRSPEPEPSAPTANVPRRPVTVRVDHQSDRLDAVEVSVKPGTTGIFRRQAFTMLEVMISLAVLATVLSSVVSSIYTLHNTRAMAQEASQAQGLGRLFAERILAEPGWGALNSNTSGNMWITSYADNSSGVPLTTTELMSKNVVGQVPALNDLKVFLERYSQGAMEAAIADPTSHVFTTPATLNAYRNFYGNVYRIVIQWQSVAGTTQRHIQIIARSFNL